MKRRAAAVLLLLAISIPGALAQGSSREITFRNGDVTLAGALLVPAGSGPFPAVVVLHGSGAEPRQWLEPVARQLVAGGYAALIYDKRGTGQSTGSWVSSSMFDLAADASAAVRFVRGQAGIDPARVGVWATSQSGFYSPLVVNETDARFLVVVSGGGASPREVEWYGYEQALEHRGIRGDDLVQARALLRRYFDYLATGAGYAELRSAIEAAKPTAWYAAVPIGRVLPNEATRPKWSWVATYDPVPEIERLHVPVLLMFGGVDPFTPPQSADIWSRALTRSTAQPTVRLFPEAGHGITVGEHGPHSAEKPRAVGFFETALAWLGTVNR